MLFKILKNIFLEEPKVEEVMDAAEKRQIYQAGPKPGAGLPGRNLAGANLSGANRAGAKLDRANLAGANLKRAHLRDADLSGANLVGTDLSGANLRNAAFNKAILDRIGNADFTGALNVPDQYLIGTVRTGRPRSKWEPYDFG